MKHPLVKAADDLRKQLRNLTFPDPVACTYNPLEYAWDRHCDYLKKFGSGQKKVLFLGMNPGPYGMAQTGVPFGEIPHVRDWLGISGPVGKPEPEHKKRPITGFDCERTSFRPASIAEPSSVVPPPRFPSWAGKFRLSCGKYRL